LSRKQEPLRDELAYIEQELNELDPWDWRMYELESDAADLRLRIEDADWVRVIKMIWTRASTQDQHCPKCGWQRLDKDEDRCPRDGSWLMVTLSASA
jgi:hypothetical protein